MNPLPGLGVDISGGNLNSPALVAPGEDLAALVFPSSINQSFAESTILRIRGSIVMPKNEGTGVLGQNSVFAFGIGIISEQAAEVITAIPNPATATGYDWDGWLFLRSSYAAALDSNATIVDVKAMRKWHSGDSIVFVSGVASDQASEAAGQFLMNLRGLFLLP